MSVCERMEPPRGGALGKRKKREFSSSSVKHPAARFAKPPPKGGSNKLLAGYLAHEFLRFGTLLGERPPAPNRKDPTAARPAPASEPEHGRRYAEASWLLTAGGARVPGAVNPTQLGRWLRIKE